MCLIMTAPVLRAPFAFPGFADLGTNPGTGRSGHETGKEKS